MNIYQNNAYRKNFNLLHFDDELGVQGQPWKDQQSYLQLL